MRIRLSSRALAACTAMVLVAVLGFMHFSAQADDNAEASTGTPPPGPDAGVVELSDAQLGMISIGAASERPFPVQTEAVGNIDFNEDMAAQVFPPYQGRIVTLYAKIGA